ncbi:MAG: AzlD domain-containing protein [Haloarculaceae archaeon]
MATSYADPVIWALVVVIGVATFALRLSFIALFGHLEEIPEGLQRALRYVPPAVLAALVFPAVIAFQPGTGELAADRLIAGVLAGAVAWRTENVFATIGVGMGVLWAVRFLL